MKIAALTARLLLGLLFFASGLIGVLHLVHPPPLPGDAGDFMRILATHNYMTFISLCDVVGGLLLLVGRFVPVGLVILGPILVNILLFHLLLDPHGIAAGLFGTLLELFLLFVYRRSFAPLFEAAPAIA